MASMSLPAVLFMATTKKQSNVFVAALSGFAIVLVVFGHSSDTTIDATISGMGIGYSVFLCAKQLVYTFHVSLFFIISGWVYESFTARKYPRVPEHPASGQSGAHDWILESKVRCGFTGMCYRSAG
jgi:hypothetical protein